MKIGIISDTHDDIENTIHAIDLFNVYEVDYVIHAGDYVFPGIVMEFEKLKAKFVDVLGNNDGERIHLLKNFLDIKGDLKGELGELEIDGIRFGVYHGTVGEIKNQLVSSGRYDILVCGHTHKIELPTRKLTERHRSDDLRSSTLVLNPGTDHKKVQSISGAFCEGGIIIFQTRTYDYEFINLP
jgi:uncharacterized protein